MEHSNAPQQTHNQNISEQNNSEQQQQQHNYRKGSPNHHLNSSTSSSSSPSHSTSTRMVADHHQLLLQPQLPSSSSPSSSTSSPEAVTIEVVYELASTIGEEFKRLLELHGEEETALTANNNNRRLVPTVVRVLELLEEAVLQREDYQRLVEQQTRTIEEQRAAAEKAAAERKQQLRYLSEIEEVDESWRRENLKLGEYVKYLKGENRRLASSLSEKLTQSLTDLKLHDGLNGDHGGGDDVDEEKTNSQLTRRISLLVKELRLKADEADQLKTANEALTEENANLRNLNATIRSNLARRREQEEEEERRKEAERSCDDEGANINNNNDSREKYRHLEEKIRSLEAQVELYRRQLKEKNKENDDTNCDKEEEEVEETVEAAEEVIVPMEDLPVQGPIPKEPDFWDPRGGRSSNRTSRILSFFPRLTRALINNSANKTS